MSTISYSGLWTCFLNICFSQSLSPYGACYGSWIFASQNGHETPSWNRRLDSNSRISTFFVALNGYIRRANTMGRLILTGLPIYFDDTRPDINSTRKFKSGRCRARIYVCMNVKWNNRLTWESFRRIVETGEKNIIAFGHMFILSFCPFELHMLKAPDT